MIITRYTISKLLLLFIYLQNTKYYKENILPAQCIMGLIEHARVEAHES